MRVNYMQKIDPAIIEALAKAMMISVEKHKNAMGTDKENLCLLKMHFIKDFSDDVIFINKLCEREDFYHRYGYLLIRNMVEQLIEFLYVLTNTHLVDEYLGLKIDLDSLKEKHTPVEGERKFGKLRYLNKRPSIYDMAEDIGERMAQGGAFSLYDAYCVLSEKCHNSYFDSLLAEFNKVGLNKPTTGLNDEQILLLNAIIACVLIEYK